MARQPRGTRRPPPYLFLLCQYTILFVHALVRRTMANTVIVDTGSEAIVFKLTRRIATSEHDRAAVEGAARVSARTNSKLAAKPHGAVSRLFVHFQVSRLRRGLLSGIVVSGCRSFKGYRMIQRISSLILDSIPTHICSHRRKYCWNHTTFVLELL